MSVMLEKRVQVETAPEDPWREVCRRNCVYRAAQGMPWTCDYAAITGKSRLAACRRLGADEEIKECPLQKKGKPGKPVSTSLTLRMCAEERTFRALHRAGLTDRRIAEKMGMSKSSIHRWRQRLGLKPNKE